MVTVQAEPTERRCAVLALTMENGLGREDLKLPWAPNRLHADMAFLSLITTLGHDYNDGVFRFKPNNDSMNTVLMGRRTWESLPGKMRPLPNRRNLVLTSNDSNTIIGAEIVKSLSEAEDRVTSGALYVLGGQKVYEEALDRKYEFFLTKIEEQPDTVSADIYFDALESCPKVNITDNVYAELVMLKPELKEKTRLVDNQIVEGPFKYSFYYVKP